MIQYRPYQIALLNQIIKSIQEGYMKPLVVLPTAGGKTILMGGLLNQLSHLYGPITSLIAVPFTDLQKQITNRLLDMGITTEVVTYPGALNLESHSRDILILDEAHHLMSQTWRYIPELIKTDVVCGFTGTPYRADAEPLLEENGGIFDSLIIGPSIEQLTKEGWIADLEYYSYPMLNITDEEPVYILGELVDSIQKKYLKIDDKQDSIIEEYVNNFKGMQSIVFCSNTQQAADIAAKFNQVGIKATDINCYQPKWLREFIIKEVQTQRTQILVGCNMMSEGLDAAHLKLAILARPIVNSLTMFLQQIGRVLRPYNNETAKVLDLVGNIYRFGLPTEATESRRIE